MLDLLNFINTTNSNSKKFMIKYNNNVVQKFKHLKYYPKTNIDEKSLKFLNNLNVSEDIALDYFIDRLNFYLSITSKQLIFLNERTGLDPKTNISFGSNLSIFVPDQNSISST